MKIGGGGTARTHGWRGLDGGCCCEGRLHGCCDGLVCHQNIIVGHGEDRLLNPEGLYDRHLYVCIVRRKRGLHCESALLVNTGTLADARTHNQGARM